MSRALLFVWERQSCHCALACTASHATTRHHPKQREQQGHELKGARWDVAEHHHVSIWSIWCHGLDTNVSTWGPTMALFARGRIIEFPSLYALNWRSVVFIRRHCSLLSVGCHSFSISARWRKSQIPPWSGGWNTADVVILVLLYSGTFLDCTHDQKEL